MANTPKQSGQGRSKDSQSDQRSKDNDSSSKGSGQGQVKDPKNDGRMKENRDK